MGTQRLPQVNGDRVVRALRRAGWEVQRIRGSHYIMRHTHRPGVIIVPVHRKPIGKGTLNDILDLAGLNIQEFRELL